MSEKPLNVCQDFKVTENCQMIELFSGETRLLLPQEKVKGTNVPHGTWKVGRFKGLGGFT